MVMLNNEFIKHINMCLISTRNMHDNNKQLVNTENWTLN